MSLLILLRRDKQLTQQEMADTIGVHVNQIRRYEAGATQPSLEVLKKIAVTLHVSIDSLVFNTSERDPDDELKLQFEAIQGFTEQEKLVTKTVLEGLILKHDANRFSAAKSD
ncbi:MAG: helix-turn-helix transcriptional regulator [Pseudoalteromonas distincta]|uniref:helix-turn-helix domain-containing protein n=1 Tax=unclassified Pseudoalteromonas TaxID=194690 RepID=UPI0004087435|nr:MULTISPECIES: helix-turn-helix transcriptional regulator [unclassified Pseudoalteromonas]